jgi:hypothetical protein
MKDLEVDGLKLESSRAVLISERNPNWSTHTDIQLPFLAVLGR